MKRRPFRRFFVASLVGLGVLTVPVLAGELLGVLTKVDADAKKVTVVDKDGKETEITVNDDTEYVSPKGANKIDLEKVAKSLERIQEKGRKGISVKVTHESGVATKIEVEAKKKGAPGKRKIDDAR